MIQFNSAKNQLKKTTKRVLTIYGKPGTGKTTFALDSNFKTLYVHINDEGGFKIAKNLKPEQIENIDYYALPLQNEKSPLSAVNELVKALKTKNDYEVIVFDVFSDLRLLQAQHLKKTQTNSSTIHQQTWGRVATGLDVVIRDILLLNKKSNLIFLCQEYIESKKSSDNELEIVKIITDFRSNIDTKICTVSDEVIHMKRKVNGKRILDFGKNPLTSTKSRHKDIDGKELTDINLTQLLTILNK